MADTTNVGTVQLDVEINPQSMSAEMNKLNKAFNNSFKNMFGGIAKQNNNFIKESISNIGNSFKNFTQTATGSNEKVSRSVSRMNAEYEKTEAKIAEIRKELIKLFAEQDEIVRSMGYKDLPSVSGRGKFLGMGKDKTMELFLEADAGYQKLSEQIDRLETKLEPLVAKNKELADEIERAGTVAQNTGGKLNLMGKESNKAGKDIEKTTSKTKLFGDEAKKSGAKAAGFAAMINRSFRSILRRLFIYNLILKGIRGIMSYTGAALKTNKQFVASLHQIKTNLMVAFQPIYDFVLPALNTLMKALAIATTYIASAISALFGKTYQQSFNAAKNLDSTKKAMAGYGKAAKKAGKETKGALMGFDEINQLDTKDSDDTGGGAGDFEMSMPDLAAIDMSGIEKFKEIISSIFEPFKKAWEKEGQATIDSIKYAIGSIKGVIQAIGKSWIKVWTNGTGQAILETFLRILQNILKIISDIANAFGIAWETNKLGTRLLQTISNMILNMLKLIESIAVSWAEVWNNGTGVEVLTHILSILQSTFDLIGQIADSFRIAWETNNIGTKILQNIADTLNIILGIFDEIGMVINEVWGQVGQKTIDTLIKSFQSATEILKRFGEALKVVWDMGGKYLFEQLILLAAKVIEVAGVIWNDFITPLAKGLLSILGPAFGRVLELAGAMIEGIIWWLDILLKALNIIKEFADGVVNFFKWMWDVIVGHSIVPDMVNAVIDWFNKLFDKTINIVGDLVKSIVEFFGGLWETITKTTRNTWNSLKIFLSNTWNSINTTTQNIWYAIKNYILNKWNEIKEGISSMKNALVNAVMEPFKIVGNKIKGIIGNAKNWGRNLIGNFIDGIKAMIGKVRDAATSVANAVKDRLGFSSPTKEGPGSDADKWMPNMMEMFAAGIKSNIAQVSAAISMTAGSIQQGVQPNTDDMASSIGNAVSQSIQGIDIGGGNMTLIIKIGEDTITDKVVSNINRKNMISGKTVIQV